MTIKITRWDVLNACFAIAATQAMEHGFDIPFWQALLCYIVIASYHRFLSSVMRT